MLNFLKFVFVFDRDLRTKWYKFKIRNDPITQNFTFLDFTRSELVQSSSNLKVYNDYMSNLELLRFTLMQGNKFEKYGISSIKVTLYGVSCTSSRGKFDRFRQTIVSRSREFHGKTAETTIACGRHWRHTIAPSG